MNMPYDQDKHDKAMAKLERSLVARWPRRLTLSIVVLALIALAGIVAGQATAAPRVVRPAASHVAPAVTVAGGITIAGLDLHDGTVQKFGDTYYDYGTEYACGYRWGDGNSSWCGFGVASAPSMDGPWSGITQLLRPTDTDPWSGRTWQAQCIRTNGAGCFNPRMVQRPDGTFVFWFNAVGDNSFDHANAYNNYTASSPTGPLGSFHKPAIYTCAACNGDFSIFVNGSAAYLVGTGSNRAEYVEQLDSSWTNGTGNVSGHGSSALFSDVEGAGIYRDPGTGYYIMTLSHPECGYCTGVRTIYGVSTGGPIGPWYAPQGQEANPRGGHITGPDGARNQVSGNSCGGQPRTIVNLDGTYYEYVDLWVGEQNELPANVYLAPLVYRNQADVYGQPWSPFDVWSCQ